MTKIVAILDSCVIFPNLLRDTLLTAAELGLYRLHWSQEILVRAASPLGEGMTRNLIIRQILTPEKAATLEKIMKSHFSYAMVKVSQELVAQMTNHLGDRHVLAAAVEAQAQVIVTFNLKHFKEVNTSPWGIEAQHPDIFLLSLLKMNSSVMVNVINEQTSRLKKPSLSVEELLKRLEKQTPQFVAALRELL